MLICRSISNIRGSRNLLNFGHWSWSGTPFGTSVDELIPSKRRKKKKCCRKPDVPFKLETIF